MPLIQADGTRADTYTPGNIVERKTSVDVPRHLLDLIRQVRPRAALFTTYTFSVSYFDAVFVPVLRSVGCQEIAVLVDANEAAATASEGCSKAAGRIYRVVPVVAPKGGVFHAKLAYFATRENDVLSVASGNLTASGQSLQLETFDVVDAQSEPQVFLDLAQWMELLSAQVADCSVQASRLLEQTAVRAHQMHGKHHRPSPETAADRVKLIHTLKEPAQAALQKMFVDVCEAADSVTVLAPFHSADGGPTLRLAAALSAKQISVGIDGRRLVAPFDLKRYKTSLPTRFVVPDTKETNKRLHAKVFELKAGDRTLVMTGSINATNQSFESEKNVEVSLARWLHRSPFKWKKVDVSEGEPTQDPSDFLPRPVMTVDAWLQTDAALHGVIHGTGKISNQVHVQLNVGELTVFDAEAKVSASGVFQSGPVPRFDTSAATQLTVTSNGWTAHCWLNVHEELEVAAEERERRSAISRVLQGEYKPEDVAQVIQLLSSVALSQNSLRIPVHAATSQDSTLEDDAAFSFMRWETSGKQRSPSMSPNHAPFELLKALTRWLNASLTETHNPDSSGVGSDPEIKLELELELELQGAPAPEHGGVSHSIDAFELLDQLCQVITGALAQTEALPHAAVLAEVVASRAVDRVLKQPNWTSPCLSWLDNFSRFSYPDATRGEVCTVAAAVACWIASKMKLDVPSQQVSLLRECIERFCRAPIDEAGLISLAEKGFARDLFRRLDSAARDAAMKTTARISEASTLDEDLLHSIRRAQTGGSSPAESGHTDIPDVALAFKGRKPKLEELIRGLLNEKQLLHGGCPFCYQSLSSSEISKLRQRHVLFHPSCKKLVMFSEHWDRMRQRLGEVARA